MKIPVKLELFAGIRGPLFSDETEARSLETHEELLELSGRLQNMISGPAGSVLSIDLIPKVKLLPELLHSWARKHRRSRMVKPWGYIYFSVATAFDPSDFTAEKVVGGQRTKIDLSAKENLWMCRDLLSDQFFQGVSNLLVAIHIARPGTLAILDPITVVDGDVQKERDSHLSDLDLVLEKAAEIQWPAIVDLPISLVAEWLRKVPGVIDNWGEGRVGRAVAGFSHLVHGDFSDNVMVLFWILLGLEALYCTSNEGLKQQLVERSAVLLGRPTNFKKALSEAYNIRSSFVHGGLDIPMGHFTDDWWDKTRDNLSSAILVTSAVLLATLQQMAARNLHELTFEQILKPDQSGN